MSRRHAALRRDVPFLHLPSVMEALESLVGGSIVTLDSSGKVHFCSDLAQRYIESYFPNEAPVSDGLPASVMGWIFREITHFESDELGIRPPQPLLVRRDERTLHIRVARIKERAGFVLLLRAEDPAFELAKLSILGMGARPTEVLYWLAKEKTNQQGNWHDFEHGYRDREISSQGHLFSPLCREQGDRCRDDLRTPYPAPIGWLN